MPIQQPFYLNAPTLAEATAVYQDNFMTTLADDGVYSDGTIVREQVSGVLISTDSIPPCNPPCSPPSAISCGGSDGNNVYDMAINTGSTAGDIGAIVIEFEVVSYGGDEIAGIEVELNGIEYNELVSPTEGFLAADPLYTTFIGISDFLCTSTPSFTGEIYDWNGISFIDSTFGLTYLIDGVFNQDKTTAANPGLCKMVVPKLTVTPEQINVRVYIPCDASICTVKVYCPTLLPYFFGSIVSLTDPSIDPAPFCALGLDYKYYYSKVANLYPGQLELFDMLYTDPYGNTKIEDGYYKVDPAMTPGSGYDTIQVINGIITSLFLNC
jgi:hypothetical protein